MAVSWSGEGGERRGEGEKEMAHRSQHMYAVAASSSGCTSKHQLLYTCNAISKEHVSHWR